MARKGDSSKWFNVAVVGLSGTEKDKGAVGIGKSCFCNRFMRSLADDYSVDHISVLSQSDFSGRVVNNDHFLYWGEVAKCSEEGIEMQFQVVEQTEFIDDASFQPFKGGKMEPYSKRCTATKLTSAEKLMYICKNQLGIEKEYEQKVLPDGKISIDGFLCLFDVSVVPGRSLEKQVEIISTILNNVAKTKKPVVLVTTKNDDANEAYVKEAEKLSQKKEYKNGITLIETSAHENINVELAFFALAQQIDRSKGRSKIVPYVEAARLRKELLDSSTEAFMSLIRSQVTDYRALWSQSSKKFAKQEEFMEFSRLFGVENTQRLFRRHVKKLKDEHLAKRVQGYMEMLPDILQEMVPEISTLRDGDWPTVQEHIKNHADFNHYFYNCPEDIPWTELDWDEDGDGTKETRIPYDVLDTGEAETVFRNHANSLQQEHKRLDSVDRWKKQFKQLLEDTGYVTPGKLLSEVRVLFMGRECFEALSEDDCHYIYDKHQKELVEKAKHNFQELLLEHADLFYHFKSIAPTGTITQDDIKEITNALKEDSRYKALDRLDQDRKLMLFQHLGFVHCPIREHCPAFPNCMDALIERVLSSKAHRPSSWNHSNQWLLNSDSNQLNLVILGSRILAEELSNEIRAQCDDDEYEMDCHLYCLEYRIIDGDVSLPQNSFQSIDFLPHGCFCIYSNFESFEYIRDSLEKTLLSNLEQEDRLPFQGLPIVILFVADSLVEENEMMKLREEGQSLADSLQCPFIDVSIEEIDGEQRFNAQLVANALRQLVQSIRHRAGFITVYQSVMECSEPDIRIIMCMFCGDPYSVENVLGPLLNHQCCFLSGERSIILETFLGSSKRKVEVIISSFHGANAFREELVHGFILVYSTKRKASLATLNAFSMNIPNLPIQIMAVTDSGGANAFFSSDLSHTLITEGNATADRLQAHFMTSTSNFQQKTAFYTPFFKEVWEKKPEIEQAFNMEEPAHPPGEGIHPRPPPRHESYLIKLGSNDNCELYDGDDGEEQMSSGTEDSDTYSLIDIYNQDTEDCMKLDNKSSIKLTQGWVDDSLFIQHTEHEDGVWMNNFSQHAFTTGRRQTSKTRYKSAIHTMKQPGKLNMKDYSLVTDAIARMNLGSKDSLRVNKMAKSTFGHAPLATPENVDLGSEYAQVKDAVGNLYSSYDGEYSYTPVQDALSGTAKHKMRHRREKDRQNSDSEWSSLERKQKTSSSEVFSKISRKPTTHKRARKKRTAIPVATPRVPPLSSNGPNPPLPPTDFNYAFKGQDSKVESLDKTKYKIEGLSMPPEEESSVDVSSPRDVNSPLFGVVPKSKEGNKTLRRKEKQRAKEEEKMEKRRQKEEKLKKVAEERERKKQKSKSSSSVSKVGNQPTLDQLVLSEVNAVPIILEKYVQFVEEEGLDSEGIYRVPGNRAHVELLFQKFDEDPSVDISSLDIPVNAVATALKDFFSKRLPPLFTEDLMVELEDLSVKGDRSCRLLALRSLLKKLPPVNFEVLKFVFHHFVRVSENCKLNSMDSKNLAICWWPTLLPIEFSDMGRFEQMRPHLEDIVQTMIDQYPFLFCGKEAFVMV